MAKEKVYKLAQEFKVSSEALVQMLRGMGIVVKSHMSTVDDNLRDEIRKKFDSERAEIKKEYDRKKQMLVKAKEDLIASAAATAEAAAIAAAPTPAPAAHTAPNNAAPQIQRPTVPGAPQQQHPAPGSRPSYGSRSAAPNNRERSWTPTSAARPDHSSSSVRRAAPTGGNDRISTFAGPGQNKPPTMGQNVGFGGHSSPNSQPTKPGGGTNAGGSGGGSSGGGGGFSGGGQGFKKHKKKGKRVATPAETSQVQLKDNVRKTLAKIGSGSARKKYKKDDTQKDGGGDDQEKMLLQVSEFVTANELANMMDKTVSEVIAKCLEMGLFVTINQRLDFETIELVVDEFGFTAQLMEEYSADSEEEEEIAEAASAADMIPRAPVVTVMGHVDHGKTSLLDYIRKTNVIAGESGGITQHIAAYEIITPRGPVTFLDTPGHEAFTAMRARGSQITDVIVLVIAADSGVMPQTKEAIDHARAANVPIVVAINKVDLPTANVDKVKNELAQYSVFVEGYGGNTSCIEISARSGKGIDRLLETLALETDIMELKANPVGRARGVVVEAELDKGKGSIATVLVQSGTLLKGDAFVTGIHYGRVRDLFNERGTGVERGLPSQPVVVLGLSGTPQAGDSFKVVEDEKEAREIAGRRRLAQKERELRRISTVSLDHLYERIKEGRIQALNLVVKGDVDGSVEALAASLEKLSTAEIKVNAIHKSVGAIKETDVMLAAASGAIIIGFHLSPNSKIRELAKSEGVDIRTYRIIYEALDEVKKAMEGMLAPEVKENVVATAVIRQVFKISKVGIVAGCMITSGTMTRGFKARLIRDDVEVADCKITSIKTHKEDVREIANGHECGITLDKVSDYREGDRIEAYEEVEVARKLTAAL